MIASPIESLVPQSLWNEAPRALIVVEEYALHLARSQSDPAATLDRMALEACVKDRLADTLAEYR
ncbi:MAG: hypothetical protein R3F55_22200 [Alphaproteobacteria bacterium]